MDCDFPVDIQLPINKKRNTMPPETPCASAGTTPDRKASPHDIIPLVTVTRFAALATILRGEKRWGKYAIEMGKAHQVESECARQEVDMPLCRYYYAGLAHEEFGDIAFSYHPDHEESCQGWANPFDTGGVVLGEIHPFHKTAWPPAQGDRSREACKFIEATMIDRNSWRQEFGIFLNRCYGGDVQPYLNGAPPHRPCAHERSLPHQYPDQDARNTDRRAWTWEIRLECHPPVEKGLLHWSCRSNDQSMIVQQFTDIQGKAATFPEERINALIEVVESWVAPAIDESPCKALQNKLSQWMQT
ncbi:MAG: hypothetical protein HQL96_02965 [Magnetococcales bacterium]|nr:hypothetical protein [Magnetococcales bacterium]